MDFHPPLYYAIAAIVQYPLESFSVLIRLLAARWVSVAMGVVTVAIAYAVGLELWSDRRGWVLASATLVSFQPMITFCTSIMNNEALEIVLFSAGLLVSLKIIKRGITLRYALLFGLV